MPSSKKRRAEKEVAEFEAIKILFLEILIKLTLM